MFKHPNIDVIEEYYKFVRTIYIINPQQYNQLFSIECILNHIIDNVEPKNKQCCHIHCSESSENDSQYFEEVQYDKHISAYIDIIEKIFLLCGGNLLVEDFQSLINSLLLCNSPCLQMKILYLIKKILNNDNKQQKLYTNILLKMGGELILVSSISLYKN